MKAAMGENRSSEYKIMSQYSIRRQKLSIVSDSQDLALSLRTRSEDINQRYILPAIEQVLAEFDRPGRHTIVNTLSVDLGWVAAEALSQDVDASLIATLKRSLRSALQAELRRMDNKPPVDDLSLIHI